VRAGNEKRRGGVCLREIGGVSAGREEIFDGGVEWLERLLTFR
jgi:hypothetical protein